MASGCGNSRVRPATAVARAAAVAVRDPWLVAPQESSWQAFGMGGTHTWGSSCWLGRNTYGSVSSVSREDIGTKSLRNFLVTESGPGIGIDYLKLLVLETLQLALIFFFFFGLTLSLPAFLLLWTFLFKECTVRLTCLWVLCPFTLTWVKILQTAFLSSILFLST